jgi:excisionase family DNA binding protein
MYTVADLCQRFGVREHTVLGWIAQGELAATNVGTKPGLRKPRWRISEQALADFELARTTTPPTPKVRRRRQDAEVVEFYK